VPLDSSTKLIGPSAAQEALEKDQEYKNVKTLLQGTPRVGENILYRIGDQEVYFIPIYTSNTQGGVVSQIGTIAAVGAAVTGTFHVGLGDDPVQAFENYLLKAAGEQPTGTPVVPGDGTAAPDLDAEGRIEALERVFADAGIQIVKPTSISVPLEFQDAQAVYRAETDFRDAQDAINQFLSDNPPESGRVYEWREDNKVNFGVLRAVGGIIENHYISVQIS
jgi:hypothetical protein